MNMMFLFTFWTPGLHPVAYQSIFIVYADESNILKADFFKGVVVLQPQLPPWKEARSRYFSGAEKSFSETPINPTLKIHVHCLEILGLI